ncbi:MAG TPA: nitrophenyl compound nitroreductase subunit ArsF family protein [Prolixibacteraceae bacterium]|nr:nitrophenyl compound nitroreductase subunit ArsF family protein [Prolixibacteraceae bacterium]HPS13050.1 nitrophenyl compound nitroreductase subunit ArsF family protein [Prolixibacteraceae bacterium]
MKRIVTLFCLVFLFTVTTTYAQCCKNAAQAGCKTTSTQCQKAENSSVKAYYFHGTRRCATCMAVEDVTKEVLKNAFNDKIPFQSINQEEDKKNPLIEKYKISGQTLLIIKGDKVVDLTNDAFMYARNNPDKFKEKLKSTINSL